MSLSRQTLYRLPKIKDGLLTKKSYEQIAEECNVHHRTIERDIRQWVDSGLFETWLKEEFLRLHPIIASTYPEIAYREVARLVGKMVTQKREITEEKTEKQLVIIRLWNENDSGNRGSDTV